MSKSTENSDDTMASTARPSAPAAVPAKMTAQQRRKRARDEAEVITIEHEETITTTGEQDDAPMAASSTITIQEAVSVSRTRATRSSRADEESTPGGAAAAASTVVSVKVRKTATVTQPTMERFSRRLVASAEDIEAKEKAQNPFRLEWTDHGSLLMLDSHRDASSAQRIKPSHKIASFDMDGTLIRTASGRQFPQGRRDWAWLVPEVPKRLKALHEDGWKIVIFTNQNGIATGKQPAGDIKGKILDLIKDAGVPMQAFVASADDLYRKPSTDMWLHLVKNRNSGLQPDMSVSVYVGDAAGRAANWDATGTKKDFSCSDRKFAFNCGLTFHTPEEFFLKKAPAKFSWLGVDPTLIGRAGGAAPAAAAAASSPSMDDPAPPHPSAAQKRANAAPAAAASSSSPSASKGPWHVNHTEVVVFCGFPAAGKSTFAKTHFLPHGYVHINRDQLKTKEKCVAKTLEALQSGRSVVVDNTNPSVEVRALYIAAARQFGVPVRCLQFVTALEVAQHLNMFREKLTQGEHKHVPRMAYNMYKRDFVAPTNKEGFTEVKQVDFVPTFPSTPAGEAARKLFFQLS